MLVCMLTACAVPTKQPSSTVVQNEPQPEVVNPTEVASSARTVAQLLEEVATLPTVSAQIAFLLDETFALQNSDQWQTSAALLSAIEPHRMQLNTAQQQRLQLAHARWLASQGDYQAAQSELTPLLDKLGLQEQILALTLARDLAWQLGRYQQAAQYQLDLLAAYPSTESTPWSYLKYAHQPEQLTASTNLSRGWLALLQAAHARIDGSDPSALQGWQLRFGDHPAAAVAAQLRAELSVATAERALVLLPLSGQYADQGQAVLDGIVMALEGQRDFEIIVRDSNGYDFAGLAEDLQRSQATTLMGPLLKDNLAQINRDTVTNVNWIALNSLEQFTAPPTLWFALEPETEYQQVARTFASRGYKRPLVLAADSNRGKQAIESFRRTFLAEVPQGNVESGVYRTPDDMKAIVQEKLGVTDSEERIWQVKITAGKILVEAEPRSRADIDAIFLAGGIEQTRLLKPFIDVNISPFMPTIPVYATSASHIRSDSLSENDLDNVRFTELPWLLPEHPSYPRLQRLLQQRTHWNYDLARLAAFGHDALLLTQRRHQLKTLPGLELQGLTGDLYWADAHIERELDWAHYDGHQVKPITEPERTR